MALEARPQGFVDFCGPVASDIRLLCQIYFPAYSPTARHTLQAEFLKRGFTSATTKVAAKAVEPRYAADGIRAYLQKLWTRHAHAQRHSNRPERIPALA
eukprot:s3001_g6.t1